MFLFFYLGFHFASVVWAFSQMPDTKEVPWGEIIFGVIMMMIFAPTVFVYATVISPKSEEVENVSGR